MRKPPPLNLNASSRGLAAARSALQPPGRNGLPAWAALLCAAVMAGAALALASVVVLGGWEPGHEPSDAAVRGSLGGR